MVSVYCFFHSSQSDEADAQQESEEPSADGIVGVALHDVRSKCDFAHVVPQKGISSEALDKLDMPEALDASEKCWDATRPRQLGRHAGPPWRPEGGPQDEGTR